MITLHGFGPNFGLQDPSPFVLKTDAFLRMSGIEFKSKSGFGNLKVAPKRKLPFIKDGDKIVTDSEHIVAHMEQHHSVSLNNWLSQEQRALVHLIQKSLDEHFYWCVVYARWIDDKVWPEAKVALFARMPWHLRKIAPDIARKKVRKTLYAQGLGRHSHEEIIAIADKYLASLSELLGSQSYFFGEQPCSFDAAAFGFLAQLILIPVEGDIHTRARQYENLVTFCQRIQSTWYSEK